MLLGASTLYVAAWLTGLLIGPGRPTTGGAGAIREYFLDHAGAAVMQSLLVHGAAGLALATFAVALARLLARAGPSAGSSPTVRTLGLVAVTLSLVQVVLLLSVAAQAGSLADQAVADRVQWIDQVDVAKLMVIGAFVVTGSRAAATVGMTPPWVVPMAAVLAALLVLGALSFVFDNGILTAAVVVSLPLLLFWVGVVGVSAHRSDRAASLGGTGSLR